MAIDNAANAGWYDNENSPCSAYGGLEFSVYRRSEGYTLTGSRQPSALVSVVLKARERQIKLQMSMRKPLNSLTYGRGYSVPVPVACCLAMQSSNLTL